MGLTKRLRHWMGYLQKGTRDRVRASLRVLCGFREWVVKEQNARAHIQMEG